MRGSAEWDLAAMTDWRGFLLGRIPDAPAVYAPAWVTLEHEDDDYLLRFPEWTWGTSEWRRVTNLTGLLDRFADLADATRPSAFVAFAERYGPLFMPTQPENLPCPWSPLRPHQGWAWEAREPLFWWRHHAARHRAYLRIGARLRQGRAVPPEDWWPFSRMPEALEGVASKEGLSVLDVAVQKHVLAVMLNVEGRFVQPEPSFVVLADLTLAVSSGFGFLPVCWHQLVQALTGHHGLYVCAACGQVFTRTRKAQAGRRTYCPGCGPVAAKRDYRRRKLAEVERED